MLKYHMLTTIDNPFNPFMNYDEWSNYDEARGYNSSAFLARVARTSSELSETDQNLAYEEAVDEIVKHNVSGMHKKVEAPPGWEP